MTGTIAPLIYSVAFLFLMLIFGFVAVLKLYSNLESRYQSSLHYLSEKTTELLIAQSRTNLQAQAEMTQIADKAISLLASADPLAFQQIQAMNLTTGSDQSSPSDLSDNSIAAAYEEAKQKGFVYDPYSLEDDEAYDAEDIERLFIGADGSPKF